MDIGSAYVKIFTIYQVYTIYKKNAFCLQLLLPIIQNKLDLTYQILKYTYKYRAKPEKTLAILTCKSIE